MLRCVKIEFFPWSLVDFMLYSHDKFVSVVVKFSFLYYTQSYKFVLVFESSFMQ